MSIIEIKSMKNNAPLLLLITLFLAYCGTIKVSDSDEIFDYPDTEAQFPGGPEGMKKYLARNIRYPEIAMQLGDQGKVYVQFAVEKDGSVSNVKVMRGVSKAIDAESIRVVSAIPNWTPAIYKRKYVRARVVYRSIIF
jgi:TonB family protein